MQERRTAQAAFQFVSELFTKDLRSADTPFFPHDSSLTFTPFIEAGQREPNAVVYKEGEHSYGLAVSQSLLEVLEQATESALDDCPTLFESRDMGSPDTVAVCQSLLMEIWIDYLLCHGLAHVVCGHLSYDSQSRDWPEIIYSEPERHSLDPYTYKRLEVDADTHAAEFSLSHFVMHWLPRAKNVYAQPATFPALADFTSAIFLLFRHLDELRAASRPSADLYPHAIDRAIILVTCCENHHLEYAELRSLSDAQKEQLFALRLADNYLDALGISRLQCLLSTIDTATLTASAAHLTTKLGLPRLAGKH